MARMLIPPTGRSRHCGCSSTRARSSSRAPKAEAELNLPGVKFDARTSQFRSPAICYRAIVEHLRKEKLSYTDNARDYQPAEWRLQVAREAFPHQVEALKAWWDKGGRGVVVLPTGTGKTHLASMAIEKAGRPTLIVTPTIDLLNQWYDELSLVFGVEIGLLGGGYYDLKPITVTTYDSAYLNMERLGNRFGFIVFDECHHLPGPTYGLAATCSIAPFRLGLTATPERADNAHTHLDQLIGPEAYRREITQLRGDYLADYRVERLYVSLTPEDRVRYDESRKVYRAIREELGNQHEPAQWLGAIPVPRASVTRGARSVLCVSPSARAITGRPGKAQSPGSPPGSPQRRPRLDLHPR